MGRTDHPVELVVSLCLDVAFVSAHLFSCPDA
jgi:hypothetical protein